MDLSVNKGSRRNIASKNISMGSDLKLSQNSIIEHLPPKPNNFNSDSNFNAYRFDQSFQVNRIKNSLVHKNTDLSVADLSKNEKNNMFLNRLTIHPLSTPTHRNKITEIEVNTLVNDNGESYTEQKSLPRNLKEPVFHSYSGSGFSLNDIIMENQNLYSSNAFSSDIYANQGLHSAYMSNFNDKHVLALQQKQLEAKAEELRIEEAKIIKQEQQAELKVRQALQVHAAALREKEIALERRRIAANKKYEEAMKSITESQKLSTSVEGLSFLMNESPNYIRSHSSQLNPNEINYVSESVNKRKFESIVPSVMVIKEMTPHATNSPPKRFINTQNNSNNSSFLHSSNQFSPIVEKEPPNKVKVLDICGVKPSIHPSKIVHTYSRLTPKKFNGSYIKSEDSVSPILPQHSNMLMHPERPNSTPKNVKEILISENGTITVSEFLKSYNSSRPSSTLSSHSQLLMPDNLKSKLPSVSHCSRKNSKNTTNIDIENGNDLVSKTKVDIETAEISCNDLEVAFTEKVQKLTTGLQLQNQTDSMSEQFSVFTGKKEVNLIELSENENDENLGEIYEDVLNEPSHSLEHKISNGSQDNSDNDFDIESSITSNVDISNNNDTEKERNNNNENNSSFSHAYTTICSENSGFELNEITVDPNFKDLVYKMENNSDQFKQSLEMDTSEKLLIQNSKLNLSPKKQNYDTLCYNKVTKIQNVEIDTEAFSNSEEICDNYHDENIESHDYWNESFSNEGKGCSDQYSEEVVCQMQNLPEQFVSESHVENVADCSSIVKGNDQQLENDHDENSLAVNLSETSNNIATCKSFEDCSVKSLERDCVSERINNEENGFSQIEEETPYDANELNIDGATIIDVNEIPFDEPSDEFPDNLSDLNTIDDEESDVEDFTSTIFREKDKSFDPFKWTLEFRQKHYYDKLFPELRCHHIQWVEVEELEERMFLSNCVSSPLFTLQSNYSKNTSWSRINCFTGKQLGSGKLIYVGGPVKCSAWCPVPVVKESQYIALSSVCNPDVEVCTSKSENHRGLIQIWDCGKLKKTDIPSLALCIAHEYGVIWSLAWCPSGIHEKVVPNDSALNRLGLLSAAFSDGVIRVYLVPHPHQLKREKIIFKKVPEFSLIHHNYENFDVQCVKVCWSPYKGHSLIAGSFTNGMVCIWDLTCSSSILRSSDTEGIKLYPINSISAHSGICSTVSFYPKTNGQHIVTGGSDRTIKFWDLSEPEHPLTVVKKGSVTDSIWIPHWSGAVFSFDDAFSICKTSTTYRGNGFFGNSFKSIAGTNATTWSISASDWLNAVAQGDEAGEVLVSYPKKLNCDNGNENHSSKHNFPLFSVQLERIKDIMSQENDKVGNSEEDSSCGKKRGRKRGRKPKSLQQSEDEPLTYSAATEMYGIKFVDDDNISKPDISRLRTKNSEPMPPGPITVYPIMGASSVSWNNNLGTQTWIFIGLNSGFGRLIKLPSCKIKIKN